MPFLITCDHCQARMRAPAKVPSGKTVKCPKCTQPFVVSDENQVEASGTTQPVTRPTAVEPPPKPVAPPKPAPKFEEPVFVAELRKDPVDEEIEPVSRRASARELAKAKSKRLKWFIGGGLAIAFVMFLMCGGGIYLAVSGVGKRLVLGANPKSAAASMPDPSEAVAAGYTPRPARNLPKDLFLYYPAAGYEVDFTDYEAKYGYPEFVPIGRPIEDPLVPVADMNQKVIFTASQNPASVDRVVVNYLSKPFDMAAAATKLRMKSEKLPGGTLYRGAGAWTIQVFQPKPDIVVTLYPRDAASSTAAADLMSRQPGKNYLPDDMWMYMQEVGGYTKFSVKPEKIEPDDEDPVLYQLDGFALTKPFIEDLKIEVYKTEAAAKKETAKANKQLADIRGRPNFAPELDVTRFWSKGNQFYEYKKQPRGPLAVP